MYDDIEDLRKMIRKAREERYPIADEHLRQLERVVQQKEWQEKLEQLEFDDEFGSID